MGAFFKILIALLCMNVMLSIAFPGSETQFLKDNLFNLLLTEESGEFTNSSLNIDPVTGEQITNYGGFNKSLTPIFSEGGNQESNFLQKFLDGLSIIKTTVKTLINIAVLPIIISIRMSIPGVVRLLFFIPLALLYIVAALMTLIRGVQA